MTLSAAFCFSPRCRAVAAGLLLLFLNSPCGNHLCQAVSSPKPMSRRFRKQPPGRAGPGRARWPQRAARVPDPASAGGDVSLRPPSRTLAPEEGTPKRPCFWARRDASARHLYRPGGALEPARPTLAGGLLLALVTIALYWPATRYDFVNYDDPLYVTDNPHVQAGLTWEGLAWAFGRVHGEGTYWHPLTWVSHMVDCQLYGLKPWGHHLTSVLLHAANAVLVFLVFRRMTGAFWRCVVLAALFALHPCRWTRWRGWRSARTC